METGLEALLLGLSVGLVCLASCGAVLVPWLVLQHRGVRATAWLLAQVLAGRLAGYLLFAVLAWFAGVVVFPDEGRTRALVFGGVYALLAAILASYALSRRACGDERAAPLDVRGALSRIEGREPSGESGVPASARAGGGGWAKAARLRRVGPAALGFLTGLNLCPPFVVASVRAAQMRSLPASLGFFALFFLGTSVWFLPFLATGAARRIPDSRVVARVAMAVVAAYYGYMGVMAFGWGVLHG